MVLAVDGSPLAGIHRRGQPQPETEEMLQRGMQLERAMRRIAMQVDGDADDRDMSQDQRDRHQLPWRQVEETVVPHGRK
ncbi:hypothetical protein D3C80_1929740 [compost metagenome]